MLKQKSETKIDFADLTPDHFNIICGPQNQLIKCIEAECGVAIKFRQQVFYIEGATPAVTTAYKALNSLAQLCQSGNAITPRNLQTIIKQANQKLYAPLIRCRNFSIKPKNNNQVRYINNINNYDINFAVGPAGTGKTYLAVACALYALENEQVDRIILSRPIVEAGEKLGFLPGDINQKVDPYLRPLYDALYSMISPAVTQSLIEKGIIDITPLAYMRGRTFNHSFIIIDESQNATREQMKMVLTRLGLQSKLVITGDTSQIDLPRKEYSGLTHATEILSGIRAIKINRFVSSDSQRHPLVKRIVKAYERHEK